MNPAIGLHAVAKVYPGGHRAVNNVTVEVPEGSLMALLGPSGCGKTTTLRLIAGLEHPDAGVVCVGGRRVAGEGAWLPPEQRRVGLVFQDGALFPHLTVGANIGFALSGQQRVERGRRVEELLALVGLVGLGERYPHQLSGGQQQRVALARALAPRPAVVLLDEPFANLDVALRVELREEVTRILRDAGATAVLVTHDQQEALSLADSVALMFDGRIAQHGTPRALYDQPASRAVATFVGEANWLPGDATGAAAASPLGSLALRETAYGSVDLLIRPEQITLRSDPSSAWAVVHVRYFGHDQLVTVVQADDGPPTTGDRGAASLRARVSTRQRLEPGERVAVAIVEPVSAFPQQRAPTH